MGTDFLPVDVTNGNRNYMINVHFSTAFLPQIGTRYLSIEEEVATLGDLFALLSSQYPDWGEEVSIDDCVPDYNLLIAVNGQLSSSLGGLDTPLHHNDRVEFHLLLTGG